MRSRIFGVMLVAVALAVIAVPAKAETADFQAHSVTQYQARVEWPALRSFQTVGETFEYETLDVVIREESWNWEAPVASGEARYVRQRCVRVEPGWSECETVEARRSDAGPGSVTRQGQVYSVVGDALAGCSANFTVTIFASDPPPRDDEWAAVEPLTATGIFFGGYRHVTGGGSSGTVSGQVCGAEVPANADGFAGNYSETSGTRARTP